MSREPVRPDQGDVLQQETHDAFSVPVSRVGISPETREVGGERKDLRSLFLAKDEPVGLALTPVRLLRLVEFS